MIIPSETVKELKEGLISLTSTIRRPGKIFITVDNAPGFRMLLTNTDSDLRHLKITMVKTDELNKNGNAVADKACFELDEELKRLEPEGNKITSAVLQIARINLNSKLRRKGHNQLKKRQDHRIIQENPPINAGDTVKVRNKTTKHSVSDIYLVTDKKEDDVTIQKIIHPLRNMPVKMMSKTYKTKQKLLVPIHQPTIPKDDSQNENLPLTESVIPNNPWTPFNQDFYHDSESDDDEDKNDHHCHYKTFQTKQSPIYFEEPSIDDMEWDDTQQQLELTSSNKDAETSEDEEIMQPRALFDSDNREQNGQKSRLKRSNAIRRKRQDNERPMSGNHVRTRPAFRIF